VRREHVALAGAGVVTWSKYTQFEANTLPFLTPPRGFKFRPSWVDLLLVFSVVTRVVCWQYETERFAAETSECLDS